MTVFTVVSLERVSDIADAAGGYDWREVVLRSKEGLFAKSDHAFARWFNAQRHKSNAWKIVEITEFPNRNTFNHAGGF